MWAYQSDKTNAVNMQRYKYHFQFRVYLFKTLNFFLLSVVGVIAVTCGRFGAIVSEGVGFCVSQNDLSGQTLLSYRSLKN